MVNELMDCDHTMFGIKRLIIFIIHQSINWYNEPFISEYFCGLLMITDATWLHGSYCSMRQ